MQYAKLRKKLLADLKVKLNAKLAYHGLHHTLDVLKVTEELCVLENVKGKEAILLKTAALLHDAGFVENKHLGHEAAGCVLAESILPDYNYSPEQIEHICQMIMATKIPQTPLDHLGAMLCDADLDYLGRTDFYPIAQSLFDELKDYGIIQEAAAWDKIQVGFLENHRFFTATNQKRREQEKQKRLNELRERVTTQ
jgi:predicted metal-dependent HD superfamily phosphohydrolase